MDNKLQETEEKKVSWISFTWNGDVNYDDDHAQDDGDDAEQTGQSAQPPGPVDVPHLQAVPGLEKIQTKQVNPNHKLHIMHLM